MTEHQRTDGEINDDLDALTRTQNAMRKERRAYRRNTLFYAAIVAGVISLFFSRVTETSDFNALQGFQLSSCHNRHSNTQLANQNLDLLKQALDKLHVNGSVKLYIVPTCTDVPARRQLIPIG